MIRYTVEARKYEGLDFWNDPLLWDGIEDTHRQFCWEDRPTKRLEVCEPDRVAVRPEQVCTASQLSQMAMMQAAYNANAYQSYLNYAGNSAVNSPYGSGLSQFLGLR